MERSLDEQTWKYAPKLLEVEAQAQDKLENQNLISVLSLKKRKARFAEASREKLKQESRTQNNIINERCVYLPSLVALSC